MILSAREIAEIRSVIQEVTDSFFVTPVAYYLSNTKLSRFNEDNDNSSYIRYYIKGLVEYTGGSVQFSQQGAIDKGNVKITFNTEDLIKVGLFDVVNFETIMSSEKDYMEVNGGRYKVKDVSLDGPIDRKNVLVIVIGENLISNT